MAARVSFESSTAAGYNRGIDWQWWVCLLTALLIGTTCTYTYMYSHSPSHPVWTLPSFCAVACSYIFMLFAEEEKTAALLIIIRERICEENSNGCGYAKYSRSLGWLAGDYSEGWLDRVGQRSYSNSIAKYTTFRPVAFFGCDQSIKVVCELSVVDSWPFFACSLLPFTNHGLVLSLL